ncbi:hypothetical protein [Arthrobacter sp.]|uniref:hypothetical protein n=1 Tax=Arthrobacter sp. TaxID=1667 RepID=UPI002590B364|nr:hypothetical protein [Arthrobacter sp.]
MDYAQGYFSGRSDRQVSTEEELWTKAVNASGRALRYLDEPQRRWYRPWVWLKPAKEG